MATHSKDFFVTHTAPFVSLRRHFWDYKLNTSKTHYIPESTEIQLPQGPPSPEIKGSIYYFLRDNEEESHSKTYQTSLTLGTSPYSVKALSWCMIQTCTDKCHI